MGTNKAWEQTKHGNKQSMGTNKAWEQTTKHGNKQQSMGTNNKAWEQTTKQFIPGLRRRTSHRQW
jgi:hypothetical protein